MPVIRGCSGNARGGWWIAPPRHPLPACDPVQARCTELVANREWRAGSWWAGIIPIRGRGSR